MSRLCLIVVHDCVVGWLSLTSCTVNVLCLSEKGG